MFAPVENVTEVVVDRKVLTAFKGRALRAYPNEILEQVVGKIVGTQARVFAFRDLERHSGKRRNDHQELTSPRPGARYA